MLPNLLSGIILGMTTDIYSLYFAPVGMITGLMAGIAGMVMKSLLSERNVRKRQILTGAFLITVPGPLVSSVINAVLFGGVTSSGAITCKNSAWHDRKHFCSADFNGLSGPGDRACVGCGSSAGASAGSAYTLETE